MGKKKKFKSSSAKKNNDGPKGRDQKPYSELVKSNEVFERYYKAQNIVESDEEFESLLNTLREPLPACEWFFGDQFN